MKYAIHPNHSQSSRFLFFPIFSILFHTGLFLFFAIVGSHHTTTEEVKKDEVIAMVDLSELPPPVVVSPPPAKPIEKQIIAPAPTLSAKALSVEAEELDPSPSEPILDPELDEELEDMSEETLGSLIKRPNNIAIPIPPSAEIPKQESTIKEPVIPEAEPEGEPEEEIVGTAPIPRISGPIEEKVAMSEPISSDPSDPVSSTSESGPAPELIVPSALKTPDPSAQEIAKPAEVQDTTLPAPGNKRLASIKKQIEENKLPPPSPPKRKPSKEKIKKSGLLGLLDHQKKGKKSRNPLFAKNRIQKKLRTSPLVKGTPSPELSKVTQKIARLKQTLLSSEKTRLMKQKSSLHPRKSKIKIVQGVGHNFGILSSAIAQEEWRLTNVYNHLLQENPNLQGNLIIEFTISPKGKVLKGHILTSSFGNPSFEKALIQAISLWKFPSSIEGETTVLYPLSFFPKS